MADIRKIARRSVLVVLVLAVIYAGAYFWMNAVANARLETELTRLRDAGEPLRLTEMVRPPIPAERNAAIPLRKAFSLLVDDHDLEDEGVEEMFEARVSFDESPFDAGEEVVAKVRTWLERNADALDLVEEALDRPECRLDLDYSDPFEMETPIPEFLEVTRLLQARAILSARDGRLPDAFEAVRSALRAGSIIAGEPTVIVFLVGMSTEEVALRTLVLLLGRGEPSEEACRGLLAAVERIDTRANAHRALRGERCFGLFAYELVLAGHDGILRMGEAWFLLPDPVFKLDRTHYLRLMALGMEVAGRPWHETVAERAALDAVVADPPWYAFLSSVTVPALTIVLDRCEKHVARLRMARLVLALEIHQRRHDALPETLEPLREILGDLPIDPLSGKPFTYRRTDEGYDLATSGREVVWGEHES